MVRRNSRAISTAFPTKTFNTKVIKFLLGKETKEETHTKKHDSQQFCLRNNFSEFSVNVRSSLSNT